MCLSLFVIVVMLSDSIAHRVVETSVGNIKGVLSSEGYYQYLGIPYGQLNQDNVFGDATPYPAFNETYEALAPGPACPQINGGIFAGIKYKDINCLNLNVFTPITANVSSNLPVLIWIFGGAFDRGSADPEYWGPKYLIRHDIIFVAINHRLGPYGFMCVHIPEISGNQGLKDQYLSFQWVQENIRAFGGDPEQVTLFGQSSGGHSIDLHLLSERERIYSKVILDSGSALAISVIRTIDKEAPLKIADHLGIEFDSLVDAVRKLSKVAPDSVLTAASELGLQFGPCVEKKLPGVDPFITHEWNYAEMHNVRDVPVLTGFNSQESMELFVNKGPETFTKDIFYSLLNKTFDFNPERLQEMENEIQTFYLGDEPISESTILPIIDFSSDYRTIYPIQRSIRKYLEGDAKNIFYYLFAYSGGRNYGKIVYNLAAPGAAHVDELGYLFDIKQIPGAVSEPDRRMINMMTTLWTNFAKYGNPTPKTDCMFAMPWIPLTNQTYNFLRIDSDLKLKRRPYFRRTSYFDLFYKYNREYELPYGVQW